MSVAMGVDVDARIARQARHVFLREEPARQRSLEEIPRSAATEPQGRSAGEVLRGAFGRQLERAPQGHDDALRPEDPERDGREDRTDGREHRREVLHADVMHLDPLLEDSLAVRALLVAGRPCEMAWRTAEELAGPDNSRGNARRSVRL
jgi:hypothetical protein